MSETPIVAEPKPGWATTEFWQATFAHALAFVITLLDLVNVHWKHGLSAVQAAIPVIALITSATLATAYHDKRLRLKMDHTSQLARTYITEVEHGYNEYEPAVEHVINTAKPIIEAVDPNAKPVIDEFTNAAEKVIGDEEQVVAAWHGDMRDAPGPDAVEPASDDAVAPATDVPAPVPPAEPAPAAATV